MIDSVSQTGSRIQEKNSNSVKRSATPAGGSDGRELSADFIPGDHDVICGKGKTCFNHVGNKNFRKVVGLFLESYSAASSKLEKSVIVSAIIQTIRSQSGDGGFVKKDSTTGLWQEVGDHLAREKVGQTIRDALHFQYRSSSKAKKKRRQVIQAQANANVTHSIKCPNDIYSKIFDLKEKVTETCTDAQFTDMFTQANLEILTELNKNQTDGATSQSVEHSNNEPTPSLPQEISYSRPNSLLSERRYSFPPPYNTQHLHPALPSLSTEQVLQNARNFLRGHFPESIPNDNNDSATVVAL